VTPDHFSLKHAYQSNDGWHVEMIDPYLWGVFGTGGANIVFDTFGRMHIGYFNWACTSVSYAWKINGIWNFEYVDPAWEIPGAGVGDYAALTVDPHGKPLMSYLDLNNLDLKFARKVEYLPSVPTPPVGSSRGKPGQIYTYTTTSQDLDNDKIEYGWDWNGDYVVDQWSGFYNSGETCEVSHVWNDSGSYSIRVIAMDEKGYLNGLHLDEEYEFSNWSDPLTITMPYAYKPSLLQFFEWLFQQFPLAFPLLRHLMGY
jgi:hypothetical protein